MRRSQPHRLVVAVSAVAALALGLGASPASAAPTLRENVQPAKRLETEFKLRQDLRGLLDKAEETCVVQQIACGETITSTLTTTDCELGDGTYVDVFAFDGLVDQAVTVDATSSDFDTFLFLLDPLDQVADTDDDSGEGTNSQVLFQLDQSGQWSILVNNFEVVAGDPGEYSLTLACADAPPPSLPDPPSDLEAEALSPDEALLTWQDNSNNESGFAVEIAGPGFDFTEIGVTATSQTEVIVGGLAPATTYQFRVRARNSVGDSAYSNVAEVTTPADDGGCFPSVTTLCLQGGRFAVETSWRTPPEEGSRTGVGLGENINDESGAFYFFNPDNVEVVVKVLDACDMPTGPRFWVFAAGLTNVEVELVVTDTVTDETQVYVNPLGMAFDPILDTDAFATCP